MKQNEHQRQISNFTFQSKESKRSTQNIQIRVIENLIVDQNILFGEQTLEQELEAYHKQQEEQCQNLNKKSYTPIKKEELEKVFKYFKKYQPIYFSKIVIKQLSYKFKKGVYIKKYKEGYYFGEVKDLKNQQEKTIKKIKSGRGVFVYDLFQKNHPKKRIYEGQWQNDKKNGLGFEVFADGSAYHGYYLDSKSEGRGKFTSNQGEIYQGQWKNGIKQGNGFWQGTNGQYYMGEWKNGKAEGYGVFVTKDGSRYEGQFKNGLKHEEGIQWFANGDIYKGYFENGKPSGYGQYYWKDKSYFKGYFSNGLRIGQGTWKKGAGNCDKYEGQYQNDKKWGYGKFTWANGNTYLGNYEADLRNGYGYMQWNDGSYYKGNWKNGVQHGQGNCFEYFR